jgi:hypothetical protein
VVEPPGGGVHQCALGHIVSQGRTTFILRSSRQDGEESRQARRRGLLDSAFEEQATATDRHLARAVAEGWPLHSQRGQRHVLAVYQAQVPLGNRPAGGESCRHLLPPDYRDAGPAAVPSRRTSHDREQQGGRTRRVNRYEVWL